jgi:hypothetical protein
MLVLDEVRYKRGIYPPFGSEDGSFSKRHRKSIKPAELNPIM